jgi:signal transduction histidine kinase
MRLVARLVLAICLAFVPVLVTLEAIEIRRELRLLEQDTVRDLELLARVLERAVPRAWEAGGEEWALQAIAATDDVSPRTSIRWVPAGEEIPPPDPELVSVRIPVEAGGVSRGVVELWQSREPLEEYARARLLRSTLLVAALLVASAGVAFALGARLVGVRLARLVEQARRVGSGDLAARVAISGRDEVAALADQMNAMTDELASAREAAESANAERLEALSQLRHADRLASIGRLASALAHELGTPLNVVLGRAKLIVEGAAEGAEPVKNAEIIRQQALRMAESIGSVLGFARRGASHSRFDLCEVTRESLRLLDPLAGRRAVRIEFRGCGRPAFVDGRRPEIEQVVANLVSNAIDASEAGGTIQVAVEEASVGDGSGPTTGGAHVRLSVRDAGPGIPDAERVRLFEPFYTTKPEGQGTGLGLWISDGIVRDHGGRIEVESQPRAGTLFTVWLPAGRVA